MRAPPTGRSAKGIWRNPVSTCPDASEAGTNDVRSRLYQVLRSLLVATVAAQGIVFVGDTTCIDHGSIYFSLSIRGSSASRRPSPINVKPNIVMAIMTAGNRAKCQKKLMLATPSRSII